MSRMTIFTILTTVLTGSPVLAQTTARPDGYKDPNTATILSVVVPGGGQLYSGETAKGATLLAIGIGAPLLGAIISTDDVIDCQDLDCAVDEGTFVPLYLGVAAALGAWIYGIVDAPDSANRMNAGRGIAFLHERIEPVVRRHRSGTDIGFRVTWPAR